MLSVSLYRAKKNSSPILFLASLISSTLSSASRAIAQNEPASFLTYSTEAKESWKLNNPSFPLLF